MTSLLTELGLTLQESTPNMNGQAQGDTSAAGGPPTAGLRALPAHCARAGSSSGGTVSTGRLPCTGPEDLRAQSGAGEDHSISL